MKKQIEEELRAIKKRWEHLTVIIKDYRKNPDADPVLIEKLEDMAGEFEKEGFQAIPGD